VGFASVRSGSASGSVADAVDGSDVGTSIGHGSQLPPESGNDGINHAILYEGPIPDGIDQCLAGENLPRAPDQREKELKLGLRQIDGAGVSHDLKAGFVDHEILPSNDVSIQLRCGRPVTPSKHGGNSGHDLPRAEGLDDIVIRPEFQAEHPVDFVSAGRQHQDGNSAHRSDFPAEIQPASIRKIDIQENYRKVVLGKGLSRTRQIRRMEYFPGVICGVSPENISNIFFVFNQKNSCHETMIPDENRNKKDAISKEGFALYLIGGDPAPWLRPLLGPARSSE